MNSMRNVLFLLLSVTMLASCDNGKYSKTKGGMPYQIFEGKDTQKVRANDVVKISYIQKINDSLVYETILPQYRQVTDRSFPYDISELWTMLELGDSVIAVQMIDTFINRRPMEVPPQLKKGDKLIHYFKIVGIFKSDSAAQADFEQTNKNWLPTEIKKIEAHLAEKKIKAVKTPSGAFIEIITPGTGNTVDSGNYVSVNYTGTDWKGKKFDSNTDSAFGHVGAYPYTAGNNEMVKGFDEAVMMLSPGGKGRVFIPSMLAYGPQPPPQSGIRPYEMLIFDIEVVDVKDKKPAAPAMEQKVDAPQPNK